METAPQQITITLPSLHPAQSEVARHSARFRVLCTGRRFGKTKLGAVLCVAAGARGQVAWWIAPTFPMAQIGFRMIKALAAQIPGVGINESTRMVYFPGGGIVQTKSADNPVSLRGEGLDLAILDECAFIAPEAWGESLRPALSDRQGRAVFISTPNRRNWFHALWIHGTIGEPDWQSWQLPTAANPFIKPEEIEAAKRDLSEDSFRQEYLAQFLQNEGAVFRNLEACLTSTPTVASEHIKHTVVGGIDWGQVKDATAVSLFCIDCRREDVSKAEN